MGLMEAFYILGELSGVEYQLLAKVPPFDGRLRSIVSETENTFLEARQIVGCRPCGEEWHAGMICKLDSCLY